MFFIKLDRSSEVYRKALDAVWQSDHGRIKSQDVMELRDLALVVNYPLMDEVIETASPLVNRTIATITRQEKELFDSQTNDAASFVESRFNNPNPDGTVNNAYGHLLWQQKSIRGVWEQFAGCPTCHTPKHETQWRRSLGTETPWHWAGRELAYGNDAYVRFSLPEHQWHDNPSPVNIMHMTFQIRGKELHATTVTQSCDLVHSLPFDLSFLTFCMAKMRTDLDENGIKLSVGTYTHFMHSAYITKSNADLVAQMIGDSPRTSKHVQYYKTDPGGDSGWNGPGWYFWDEVGSCMHGPHPNQESCIREMQTYAATLG